MPKMHPTDSGRGRTENRLSESMLDADEREIGMLSLMLDMLRAMASTLGIGFC